MRRPSRDRQLFQRRMATPFPLIMSDPASRQRGDRGTRRDLQRYYAAEQAEETMRELAELLEASCRRARSNFKPPQRLQKRPARSRAIFSQHSHELARRCTASSVSPVSASSKRRPPPRRSSPIFSSTSTERSGPSQPAEQFARSCQARSGPDDVRVGVDGPPAPPRARRR